MLHAQNAFLLAGEGSLVGHLLFIRSRTAFRKALLESIYAQPKTVKDTCLHSTGRCGGVVDHYCLGLGSSAGGMESNVAAAAMTKPSCVIT